MEKEKIRCMKCGWEPDKTSRWICSCGHSWNTFETDGVCPKCNKEHVITQCLDCGEWSDFYDWKQIKKE